MKTSYYWFLLALTVALLAALAALIVLSLRTRRVRQRALNDNRRFGVAMSRAFDNIYELDLTANQWNEVGLLNGLLVSNPVHETLTDYMARYLKTTVQPEDQPLLADLFTLDTLRRLSRDSDSEYHEFRRRNPAGGYRWCSLVAQGIRRQDHRDVAVVMLYLRDIDDSKREEE